MRKKIRTKLLLIAVLFWMTSFCSHSYSHCQIPCGIYDDPARFDMIAENITTIEKSITQIIELSKQEKPDYNQLVRWVNNKEKHADDTAHIITYYFMAQRLKPVDKTDADAYEKYVDKLTLLHQMLIYSMKTRQSADLANVQKLRDLSAGFKKAYSGPGG